MAFWRRSGGVLASGACQVNDDADEIAWRDGVADVGDSAPPIDDDNPPIGADPVVDESDMQLLHRRSSLPLGWDHWPTHRELLLRGLSECDAVLLVSTPSRELPLRDIPEADVAQGLQHVELHVDAARGAMTGTQTVMFAPHTELRSLMPPPGKSLIVAGFNGEGAAEDADGASVVPIRVTLAIPWDGELAWVGRPPVAVNLSASEALSDGAGQGGQQ